MRLMFFSFELPKLLKDADDIVGGAAVQWDAWISGFLNNGHDFGLLTWKGAGKYISKEIDFDLIECYDPEKGISKIRVLYYQIPALIKAIKNYNPDYLIQGSATAHTGILMLISKLLRIKFIHRIANDADVDERISTIVHKREIKLYKLGVKYADIIFTQNSYQLLRLKEKFPQKKIYLLHNPFKKLNHIKILNKPERKYISWLGNFRYIKNIGSLLEIAPKFPNIIFKVAGAKHTDIDNESIRAIEKLKSYKNVEFVGYLKRIEISRFLQSSYLLLNTSYYEGFSNTFLESWYCGTPVVTTINANPDNILIDYSLGEVAADFGSLPNSVNKIINMSEQEYNNLAHHCKKYVEKYHNPEFLAQKFINYLEIN